MGSLPKDDDVKFVVTGFSRFHGVSENPTEEIANELPSFCARLGQTGTQGFYECTTLRVSADACDRYLEDVSKRAIRDLMGHTVVWIHLGVDPGAKAISLECQAINNASFLSADEDGCQFMYHSIDTEFPYDEVFVSRLNIDAIIERLAERDVQMCKSCDAGRYICNWIYFRSLRQTQLLKQDDWYSVFVHVPHFHHISKEKQLNAISSLVDVIREFVKSEKQDRGIQGRLPKVSAV